MVSYDVFASHHRLSPLSQRPADAVLNEEESFIDATFAMAKGGGAEIGPTKRGKGLKIMAIVDRHGLPLSVSTHAANHHEVCLVQLCFDFYMIETKPDNLIDRSRLKRAGNSVGGWSSMG